MNFSIFRGIIESWSERNEHNYKGDDIEVTLDWYEDNDTVELEVLK